MKTHRFYTQEKIIQESQHKSVDAGLVHQLRDVFRMRNGEEVILFDGTGFEFPAIIELITRKEVVFDVGKGNKGKDKTDKDVHLFMSIIKKDNLELVLEKATELGVASVTPVIAERSQYKQVREDRLKKIVKEAGEQSGRTTLPEVRPLKTVGEVIAEHQDVLVLHMGGSPISEISIGEDVRVLIGPEGGWSERELELFKKKDIKIVSLPFKTLRAETAVIAGLALLQK